MKLNIMTAFLLALAIILSQISPSFGLIPDFSGIILIIIIILNKNYKKALICGIFLGVLSALTIKAPNGQIPVFVDKVITSNVVYLLVLILKDISKTKSTNIILFIGLFIDNFIFFTLWFSINGALKLNYKFSYMILIELTFMIIISSIINTMIGKSIMILINKCIRYDLLYKN
jgi:hypothetical protein